MAIFNKSAIDLPQQLKKCEQNGLVIDDKDGFILALKTIGYYRLKGYLLPFMEPNQTITSSQLLAIYILDRKLRLLFLSAIERIEIALKAIVNDHMSLTYDPFWFNNPEIKDTQIENDCGFNIINPPDSFEGVVDKFKTMFQRGLAGFVQHRIVGDNA